MPYTLLRDHPYLNHAQRGSPLRRVITADREGYRDIVCASLVSWYRLRFNDGCSICIFRFSFVLMEKRRC